MNVQETKTVEALKDSVQVDIQWAENGGYELPERSSPYPVEASSQKNTSTSGPPPHGPQHGPQDNPPGIHPSVILYMPAGEPPRVLLTDESGAMLAKVVSYLDILYMLEESATVAEISRDPVQTRHLPPLPEGAMLVTSNERLSASSYTVTGVLPPETHIMPLDSGGTSQIFEVSMPHLVYRVTWDERSEVVVGFSLGVLSPEHAGPVTHEAEVYAYPFSNTYDEFQDLYEGVCWPVKREIKTKLHEVPNLIVRAFVASPNTTGYTRDVGPLLNQLDLSNYEELLEKAEKLGAIPHDWLKPAAMNVQQLHDQTRRTS